MSCSLTISRMRMRSGCRSASEASGLPFSLLSPAFVAFFTSPPDQSSSPQRLETNRVSALFGRQNAAGGCSNGLGLISGATSSGGRSPGKEGLHGDFVLRYDHPELSDQQGQLANGM